MAIRSCGSPVIKLAVALRVAAGGVGSYLDIAFGYRI